MMVMTFVDATLWRRHRAAVLVQLPVRGGVENPGQSGAEEVMMMTFVVVLERGDELRHGREGPGGGGWLGTYVEAFHEAPLFLSVFLAAGT